MRIISKLLNWMSSKFEAWLEGVGRDYRPEESDYDSYPENEPQITRSDRLGDEYDDWNDWSL